MIVTVLLIVMSGRFQTRRQPYTDAAETQLTPGPPTGAANILSSAFPHLAAKLADRATGAAVTSSSNMNYLAQYMMDLLRRAEQTPAEFWRQRDNGSVIPLVALDLISAPASQAFVEGLFSVCGMLTTGRRNRMRKSLRMRSWLKVNYNEICDLQ